MKDEFNWDSYPTDHRRHHHCHHHRRFGHHCCFYCQHRDQHLENIRITRLITLMLWQVIARWSKYLLLHWNYTMIRSHIEAYLGCLGTCHYGQECYHLADEAEIQTIHSLNETTKICSYVWQVKAAMYETCFCQNCCGINSTLTRKEINTGFISLRFSHH